MNNILKIKNMNDILKHRQMVTDRILKSCGATTEDDDLEKARSGVYADNAQNKALNRVGQQYGSKKQEEAPKNKEGKTDDKTAIQTFRNKMSDDYATTIAHMTTVIRDIAENEDEGESISQTIIKNYVIEKLKVDLHKYENELFSKFGSRDLSILTSASNNLVNTISASLYAQYDRIKINKNEAKASPDNKVSETKKQSVKLTTSQKSAIKDMIKWRNDTSNDGMTARATPPSSTNSLFRDKILVKVGNTDNVGKIFQNGVEIGEWNSPYSSKKIRGGYRLGTPKITWY